MSEAYTPDPESGRLLQLRDETAWRDLVQREQQALFRLAYLMLGDADDAEDVAQEAFIRAYHAIDRFDPGRPVRPWLLAITSNLARNRGRALRRFGAMLRRLVFVEPELVEPESRPVPRAIEQQARADALWRAVRALSPNDAEVIYLRHFLSLSEMETAQTLGVAVGTVKSRHSRALTRLRTVIDARFPELCETGDAV